MAIKIVQGEDINLKVSLKNESGSPYDLTGATAIKAKFKGISAVIERTLVAGHITIIGASIEGVISINLDDAITATMKKELNGNFEIIIDKGTDRRIVQIEKMISVVASVVS